MMQTLIAVVLAFDAVSLGIAVLLWILGLGRTQPMDGVLTMTTRLPFTKVGIKRAIAGAEAAGKRVVGIRPDGTLIVDSGETDHPFVPKMPQTEDRWSDVEA